MKKILLTLLLFLVAVFLPTKIYADGEFLVDTNAEYKVDESGKTQVTQAITIENQFSNIYATSYSLVLDNIDPVSPRAFQDGKPLKVTTNKNGDKTTVNITFDDAVVGKGKTRSFYFIFDNDSFATRTGEVWEVSIPKVEDNSFRTYNLTLSIPISFGQEAYISPKANSVHTSDGRNIYLFNKDSILKTPITAGFGAFQVFSFNLNYHLENPLNRTGYIEIAIPPDTSLQKVYYQTINPAPSDVYLDTDGNWLAKYVLKPRERLDVNAAGQVQIFAGPRPYFQPTNQSLVENLKETKYWQVNDEEIQALAKKLKTPRAIYEYVVNYLQYDYERVKPNITRFGAKDALKNPKNSICMEFTDLFIAIARAAGIPSREINGYAYTENPKIQPLSLVADVLHSWPEYWDSEKKTWVAVDPTWGSTTGGVNYFDKLDLRHFAFVIHGVDPEKPYPPGSYKLGTNPQKDVFVSFGTLPEVKTSRPEITIENIKTIPFYKSIISIQIKNPGPIALYSFETNLFLDDKLSDKKTVEELLPFGTYKLTSSIPFSFLGTKTPNTIKILAGESELNFPTPKNLVIIYNLLALFLIFSLIVVIILIRLKKLRLPDFGKFFKNEKPDIPTTQNNDGQNPIK